MLVQCFLDKVGILRSPCLWDDVTGELFYAGFYMFLV